MKAKSILDPLTVQIAAVAYEDACERLPEPAGVEVKQLLARRILGTASLGERDPVLMRDDALSYVAE